MFVRDVMTKDPACCNRDTALRDVARMMVDHDCGEIPVVEKDKRLVGVITDRDIVIRALAEGKDPLQLKAADCMSQSVVTIRPEASVEECAQLMKRNRVRRLPVVDQEGRCCGIVAQADLARKGSEQQAARVVQKVSQPSGMASSVR
jgi:CBS domain-containing protein